MEREREEEGEREGGGRDGTERYRGREGGKEMERINE